MSKILRMTELETAIVSAVATLDQADGSRIALIESIDNARRKLSRVMPKNFDDLITKYLETDDEDINDLLEDEV
jgi:ribosomal 50S subunit-associated protein YjgA (DUF615 family)